jgi:hypothetical protein
MIYIFATIILYDHVMHGDTIIYDIPKGTLGPKIWIYRGSIYHDGALRTAMWRHGGDESTS